MQTTPNNRPFLLKPLKEREASPQRFLTFDIEANDWIKFEMGGVFDGETYSEFTTMSELFRALLTERNRHRVIYSHFGGKYDLLFLLKWLHTDCPREFNYDCVLQGSKIIRLTMKRGASRWYFQDSSALFPGMSLEKVASSFGSVRKLVGTIDFEGGERVSRTNAKHREYLEADCRALHSALKAFFAHPEIRRVKPAVTLASLALKLWRTTLKAPLHVTTSDVQDFVRRSYAGGRVEVFRMQDQALNVYDVNSLFPSVMSGRSYPTEYLGFSETWNETRDGFIEATVEVPDQAIPPLGTTLVAPDGVPRFLFPAGRFRGVWYSRELRRAMEKSGVRILRVHRFECFEEEHGLFDEHVDRYFALKARSAPGSPENLVAKLVLNSTYGKFGQRETTRLLKTWEGEDDYLCTLDPDMDEKWNLIEVEKEKRAPSMLCHLASAVTAYARMELHEILTRCNVNPAYCDTDSIFTKAKLSTGEKLGELKLEKSEVDGIFLAPKSYMLLKDGIPVTTKLKGFSTKFARSLSPVSFEQRTFEERSERVASLKIALARHNDFLTLTKTRRRMITSYAKRRVLRSGETEPWIVREGTFLNHTGV